MTRYLEKSFTVGLSSKAYRENFDRVFTKDETHKEAKKPVKCKTCKKKYIHLPTGNFQCKCGIVESL